MLTGILCAVTMLLAGSALAADADQQQLDFFETKIRPVLVEHCYECHAADSKILRGGLLADTREGLRTGGDSGPAVLPGDADESLLLSALRYDDFEMPPAGKLPEKVIADFEQWIESGAVDPRSGAAKDAKPRVIDIEAGRAHWAYQPIRTPSIPKVSNDSWTTNDVDRFVLAKLDERGLAPAADAEKIVLVRRIYFDLIGLPPTPDEIDTFVNDSSPLAYERLADRLLASPRFGERWGRHWLDVVRFAESLTLRGFVLKEAWRYRDYVIDSFNEDRPYDQFLTEQIAGDLLTGSSLEAKRRNLIATTFLMMGNTNLEDQDKQQLEMDFVDEQLDVISRGLLAQTITCARCHDHKFDPIPTSDYYAMAGILKNVQALKHANVSEWMEVPLPADREAELALESHAKAVASLQEVIALLKKKLDAVVVAIEDLRGIVVDDADAQKVGEWMDSQYEKHHVGLGYCHDKAEAKGEKTISFLPLLPSDGKYEVRFAYTPGPNRSPSVPVTVFSAEGEKTIHVDQRQTPAFDGSFISLGEFRFEVDGQSYVMVSNEGTIGHVIADTVQFLPAGETAEPVAKNDDEPTAKEKLAAVQAELATLRKDAPPRPMVMSVIEKGSSEDLKIHVRGSVHSLGEIAPRGVLQVATLGLAPQMPVDGSGRRELAAWIVDPQNPLTSRVMVNRVWHWLIGAGLVRTVDNFGTTGETPSHPELLDHLAQQFVNEGWSVKQLIRTIVLSRTYRLASAGAADPRDPENRLLAHMNRRRLDAESLRDAMLSVAGTLDLEMGGPSFPAGIASDYSFEYDQPRRSVYAPVFRNRLPEMFEVFDFANPSMVTGRRDVSTAAPQALFLMNHPFVRTQAQFTAARLLAEPHDQQKSRIERVYWVILGRAPTTAETALSERFVQSVATDAEKAQAEAWTQLVQSLFSTIDFRYVR